MRRWCKAAAAAMLTLMPTALTAQDLPLIGRWCSVDQTETMLIELSGVAFNEHTICDAAADVGDGQQYQTELSCRNVYFFDGETVELFQETLSFSAVLSADEILSVLMRDETEPFLYRRCAP